mgnify:CR=1 FL=1
MFAGWFFDVIVYTVWLKRSTPQNIVIGGAAGALPPMIGWAAATGSLSVEPVLLFLIIFFFLPLLLALFGLKVVVTSVTLGSGTAVYAGPVTTLNGSVIAATLSGPALLPTVLVALAFSTLLTGAMLVLLGQLRLGGLVRYIPYPVIGGFLAGIGGSFLSERAIQKEKQLGLLRAIPIKDMEIKRSFYIITNKKRTLSPLCRELKSFLLKQKDER